MIVSNNIFSNNDAIGASGGSGLLNLGLRHFACGQFISIDGNSYHSSPHAAGRATVIPIV